MYNHKGFDVGHTWWSSGFPYFLQFQSEFGNKEFMIWATVSSRSCFCWLYRASPFLAAKNIINLISVLTIWWCPCIVFSCVVGKGCLLWPVHSLGKTLLAFALLHFVLQGQICLLLQVSLDFLLLHSSPLWWKENLFFSAISKASLDKHFAFLSFFFLGIVLITASYTMSQTSVHSSSGTLSDLVP